MADIRTRRLKRSGTNDTILQSPIGLFIKPASQHDTTGSTNKHERDLSKSRNCTIIITFQSVYLREVFTTAMIFSTALGSDSCFELAECHITGKKGTQ